MSGTALDGYRRYVYEAGALKGADGKSSSTIDEEILEKERNTDFQVSRLRRFRYRTRYFSDYGIIGSKEFVSTNYRRFKHIFQSKHEKKPKPIKGLDGMYSLKRLKVLLIETSTPCFARTLIPNHLRLLFRTGATAIAAVMSPASKRD